MFIVQNMQSFEIVEITFHIVKIYHKLWYIILLQEEAIQ